MMNVEITGGTKTDERPEGWADEVAELICDFFGLSEECNEGLVQ